MNHLCCWQVTGLYTPGRGEITSLDAGNIDDILSEFLPCVFVCLNEAVSSVVSIRQCRERGCELSNGALSL